MTWTNIKGVRPNKHHLNEVYMLLPSYASIRASSKKFEKRDRQEPINIDELLFHQVKPRNTVSQKLRN